MISLRTFTITDLGLIEKWLDKENITFFFGEPAVWINEISNHLPSMPNDWKYHYMVEINNIPIGFTQYYDVVQAPIGKWANTPDKTAGIDYLIGEEQYLGKGYGHILIKAIVKEISLTGRFRYIIADPNPADKPSTAVLLKNGFIILPNGLYQLNLLV